MASPATRAKKSDVGGPILNEFHHISIPVKDMQQSLRFFQEVLGAEPVFERDAFSEVRFGRMILGLSLQKGGWTAPDAEFPHYAFLVEDPDDLWPVKARLEAHGVPTHPIWTRNGHTGLMYFRDNTGNLFELYCPRVRDEDAPKMARREDGFVPPVASLSYEWNG